MWPKQSILLLIILGKIFNVTQLTSFIYLHVVLVAFNMWEEQLYHYINVLLPTKKQNLVVNIWSSIFELIMQNLHSLSKYLKHLKALSTLTVHYVQLQGKKDLNRKTTGWKHWELDIYVVSMIKLQSFTKYMRQAQGVFC